MEVAPFLSIFTIFCRFSPFFIDFHDLCTFVAIYILSRFTHFFRNFFWPKWPSPQHHTFFACMVPLTIMVAFQPLKPLDPLHWLTTIENHQVQRLPLQNHWQIHPSKILPSIRSTSLKSPICTRKRSGCTAAFVHSGKTQVTLESNRSTTSSRNPGSCDLKMFRAEWGCSNLFIYITTKATKSQQQRRSKAKVEK